MDDNKLVKTAAAGFLGLVVIPVVVGGVIKLGASVAGGISKLRFKHKINKGLKEGTIVEIDGQFYEVKVDESNEEA